MFRQSFLRITNKLAILGTAALWLCLLAALLGQLAWPFDLFAHFRVQYAALFVVLACVLMVLRRFWIAVAAAAGFGVSIVPLLPYIASESVPVAAATATREETFRVVSFNVWFRNPDMARVAEYIEKSQADAVVLLELTQPQAERLLPLLPTYPHYQMDNSRMGAAVFTKWPVISAESVPLSQGGAVASRVMLDWRGTSVTVLGVHLNWPLGPRNSAYRNQELNSLVALSKAQGGPLLVAGDFNLTPWSEYFSDALEESGLRDAALGFGLARTWPSQFAPVGIRIDHCLMSRHWRSLTTSVGPSLGSDHLPIVADVVIPAVAPGG
ncbi:endonuclease/exonuclease/phosphatase family protein [Peristeroidobacter soli]|uniref:endonuclease/exonuclease/phosphatase family protein n=1 Tax=Peristeroidobacter soli TaxID=2497877 RepID=UPI00101C5984|nr:endonuclease/exonuclease/phosphatase family protein [Peristeroidobacter soli]